MWTSPAGPSPRIRTTRPADNMRDVALFYDSVFESTCEYFNSNPSIEIRRISIAGIAIECRFAGAALIPSIMTALKHLIEDNRRYETSYRIDIWDSESTHQEFPIAPCGIDDISVRGELAGFTTERYEAAFFAHARMLTLIDHDKKHGIVCLASGSDIPAFEVACPLRGILSWILRRNETAMVHVASVGTSDGFVLIGGKSGAGKSSTALRGLVGGLFYMGDDICAISIKNNMPTVHGIYSSGKTISSDLKSFPTLASSAYMRFEDSYEKEVYFLHDRFHSQLPRSGEIKAVIIPHQDPSLAIGFQRIPIAKTLSIICSSTRNLLPNAGDETFRILSSILHRSPCFRFDLGDDPSLIADSLVDFISSLKHNRL